jgi:hypothetical protein
MGVAGRLVEELLAPMHLGVHFNEPQILGLTLSVCYRVSGVRRTRGFTIYDIIHVSSSTLLARKLSS